MEQLTLDFKEDKDKRNGISLGDTVRIVNLRPKSKNFYNYFNFNVQRRKGEVVSILQNEGFVVKIRNRKLAFYFGEVKKIRKRKRRKK